LEADEEEKEEKPSILVAVVYTLFNQKIKLTCFAGN